MSINDPTKTEGKRYVWGVEQAALLHNLLIDLQLGAYSNTAHPMSLRSSVLVTSESMTDNDNIPTTRYPLFPWTRSSEGAPNWCWRSVSTIALNELILEGLCSFQKMKIDVVDACLNIAINILFAALETFSTVPVHFSEAPPTCNQGCRVPAQWRSASYRFNGPVWTRLNIELNWTFPCWIELFPHWIELFSTLRQRYRKYKMLDGTVIFDRFDLGKAESIMLGSFVGVVKVDESYSDPLPFFFLSKIKCQNTKSPS